LASFPFSVPSHQSLARMSGVRRVDEGPPSRKKVRINYSDDEDEPEIAPTAERDEKSEGEEEEVSKQAPPTARAIYSGGRLGSWRRVSGPLEACPAPSPPAHPPRPAQLRATHPSHPPFLFVRALLPIAAEQKVVGQEAA
jgi:hypothetical protein